MKKRLLALLLAIVGLSGLLGFGVTRAADIRTADFTNIGRDEVIDSSLYVAGATITMQGTVKGDLFCAGQSVEIDGVVEGDVLCASQTLRINGTVIGDIRAAAQTAVVGAQVGRSASILGQTVTLSEDARVQADLTIFGNALHILGQVGRDMVGGSEVATIAGVIGRDIEMASNSVTLVDDARVNGNFIYTSNNDATVSQSAVVGGTTQRKDPQTQQNREQASPLGLLAGPLYWFAAMFLVGFAALLVSSRAFDKTSAILFKHPLAAFGLGLVVLILTPIVAVLIMMSAIGVPLALVVLALWLAALLSSSVISAYALGSSINSRIGWTKWPQATALLTGLLILALLGVIPFVGWIAMFAAVVWGLGTLTLALTRTIASQNQAIKRK